MDDSKPLLDGSMRVPRSLFTLIKDTSVGKRPQAIAHRGYKAANPENTMGAFKGAVDVGAHAIETDLHLSKDGVVVLSHDPTLKRCFGKDEKIADCNWEYLKTLRTTQEPRQPMPRLQDLLEYLTSPGLEDIWVLLDIKVSLPTVKEVLFGEKSLHANFDKRANDLFRSIASTLNDVESSHPWNQRVVVGCWSAKYLPLCLNHFPGYPITHIGFSIPYARQFLQIPNINLNMFQQLIIGPFGLALLQKARKSGRSTFLWTVNDEAWMIWSINKGVDGVITDDPKKYIDVCKSYKGEKVVQSWKSWRTVLWWNWQALLFSVPFRIKQGFNVDIGKIKKSV